MVISGVHSPSKKIGASDHGLASGERKKERIEDF